MSSVDTTKKKIQSTSSMQNSDEKSQSDDLKENKTNHINNTLYKSVDIDFIYNSIQETDAVTLIDLRTWEEYSECHIHQAFHITIEPSYLNPKNDSDKITKVSQLLCSNPQKLTVVYGKLVILYGNNNTNSKYYDFILNLIDKQNCGNFRYFVLSKPFNTFKSKYSYLCIYNDEIIKTCKKPLFNQLYIEIDENKQELEESNIRTYKRYQQLILFESGYPNIITNKLYLGDGRQAMNWSVIYNLKITHILNVTRLIPNQFDGNNDLTNIISINSIRNYFIKNALKYLKFQVLDMDKEPLTPHFEKAFTFIDNALGEENNKVLIHCQQGISRSSTMLIGYIMYSKQWTLVDTYQHVKQCRKRICPNKGFLKQLVELEKRLFNGKTTVNQIEERGIRDLKQYRNYLQGKGRKQRNEALMLKESVKAFFAQTQEGK